MRDPETRRAKLWCKGCSGPTAHAYDHARAANGGHTAWRLVFACEICRRLRVWGTLPEAPDDGTCVAYESGDHGIDGLGAWVENVDRVRQATPGVRHAAESHMRAV